MSAVIYESLAHLGPYWSALFAGFAVMGLDGQMYLTASGETYLATIGGAA